MRQKSKSIKEQVDSQLANDEESEAPKKEEKPVNLTQVVILEDGKVQIENQPYVVSVNYRDAVIEEAIAKRYNTIFNKYDYIVGDWGYDQLRLKGFFNDKNTRAPQDKKISFLEDYLYEYCNFGCAYFVLEKEISETKKARNKRKRKRKNTNTAFTEEKIQVIPKNSNEGIEKKKNFVIKQSDKKQQINNPRKNTPKIKEEAPKTSFQIHKLED